MGMSIGAQIIEVRMAFGEHEDFSIAIKTKPNRLRPGSLHFGCAGHAFCLPTQILSASRIKVWILRVMQSLSDFPSLSFTLFYSKQ